jgi:hypothetical protein
MKKNLIIILSLLFFSCISNDSSRNEKSLPPPPDTSIKYVIHYKGQTIIFKTESEQKKFLDSLNIKDTILRHFE